MKDGDCEKAVQELEQVKNRKSFCTLSCKNACDISVYVTDCYYIIINLLCIFYFELYLLIFTLIVTQGPLLPLCITFNSPAC